MEGAQGSSVILYDGVCGLCDRLVRFVLRHDSRERFRFASLQSPFAAAVLARYGANPQALDTMYVVEDYARPEERLISRSDATSVILKKLGGAWGILGSLLTIVPRGLRNWAYNRVARDRYRIFGKFDSCPVPDPRQRHRFLDQSSG